MRLTLKQLLDRPELLTQAREADEKAANVEKCAHCGVALQETITGKRPTPDGDACSDCYYEELGELIEQHPIVSGGNRRG